MQNDQQLHNHKLNKPYSDTLGAATYAMAIGAILAISFAFAIFLAVIAVSRGVYVEELQTASVNILISLLIQTVFIVIYSSHIKRAKTKPTYHIKFKIHPMWYLASVVLGIVCLVCFIGITMVFVEGLRSFGVVFPEPQLIGINIGTDILVVFTVVVAASIGEEFIFRGSLLSGLVKRFSIPVAAVLSGILFSLMHMNPAQTVYQFFLGFAAAYLVIYSKSVICGIIIHAVSNGLVILAEFWGGLDSAFDRIANFNYGWSPIVFMAAGVALIVGSCMLINRFFNKHKVLDEVALEHRERRKEGKGRHEMAKKSGIFWVWIIIPLVVCVAMWFVAFFTFMN